jgi:hypothetical protein
MQITRPKAQEVHRDTLVYISDDGTAEILPVVDKNEERILAGREEQIAVPIGDLDHYTGKRGRIYFLKTTSDNVQDCQRIASLERSTVLKQITMYEPERLEETKAIDLTKMMLFGLVAICLIIIGVK